MKTEIGLVLRLTGDNIPMSEANGVNVDTMKIVGYMISNGLIALCGSLFAQNDGFSDVTSGTGNHRCWFECSHYCGSLDTRLDH